MLSHDTLHSKQVIKVQDLIKHYDSLLASGHEPETHVIVNSVRIEDDKWNRLARQSVDVLLVHLQSQDQSLLDIYSTQLTLFDVVSSVELRSIDPFVIAFRALNDILSSVNGTRDETFSVTLLRILHDVILRILTNTRQLRGQIDMTLVSLASDYLYVLISKDKLTPDEIAANQLYTMAATRSGESLYFVIHKILRTADQSFNGLVFRGIDGDLSNDDKVGDKLVWRGFSACTQSLSVLSDTSLNLYDREWDPERKRHFWTSLGCKHLPDVSNSIAQLLSVNQHIRSVEFQHTSTTDNELRSICESAATLGNLFIWDCDSLTVQSAVTLAELLNKTK
ncbi:unnamed protein product [Rotaria sp. Silwood1]|nr:unnamed protein product [Rotaria sp. Silwood1]